jgi:hypothetical protein
VLEDEARRSEVLRMLRGEEGGSSVLGGGDKTRQALQQFFPGLYGTMQPLEEGKHGPALRDVCRVVSYVCGGCCRGADRGEGRVFGVGMQAQ